MTCSASSATSSSNVLLLVVVVVLMRSLSPLGLQGDHGADALTGEELEQQRVRDAAVEDVSAVDATAQRLDARDDLRDHALRDLPVRDETLEAGDVGVGDQRCLVAVVLVDPGDVGEVHELL